MIVLSLLGDVWPLFLLEAAYSFFLSTYRIEISHVAKNMYLIAITKKKNRNENVAFQFSKENQIEEQFLDSF